MDPEDVEDCETCADDEFSDPESEESSWTRPNGSTASIGSQETSAHDTANTSGRIGFIAGRCLVVAGDLPERSSVSSVFHSGSDVSSLTDSSEGSRLYHLPQMESMPTPAAATSGNGAIAALPQTQSLIVFSTMNS